MVSTGKIAVSAKFDWKYLGEPVWEIDFRTSIGTIQLSKGGHELWVNEVPHQDRQFDHTYEYLRIYHVFQKLIEAKTIDCDPSPMKLALNAIAMGSCKKNETQF